MRWAATDTVSNQYYKGKSREDTKIQRLGCKLSRRFFFFIASFLVLFAALTEIFPFGPAAFCQTPIRYFPLPLPLPVPLPLPLPPPPPLPASSTTPVKVFLSTRLPLTPWALDGIRRLLERDLAHPVTLLPHPASTTWSPEDLAGDVRLLNDDGKAPSGFLQPVKPVGSPLVLVWLMAYHPDLLQCVASAPPVQVITWFETLRALREIAPERFPWFESLYQPQTLLHLEAALEGVVLPPPPPLLNRDRAHKQEPGIMGILHRAFEDNLLNPLAIEADENLAFDVFEAGDAVFSTFWMPLEVVIPLIRPPLRSFNVRHPVGIPGVAIASGEEQKSLFMAVPGLNGPTAIPLRTLHLLALNAAKSHEPAASYSFAVPLPEEMTFITESEEKEAAWIARRYPLLYGKLIRGEP